ncbi:hypothetical protein H257_12266 [Aphanomyces astaci]|uniref:Uncharacterized protein n=1 Tax=Aphanomyces astaci TaxID=112090 RepID=W4G0X0_APHAT|nr:hypothetical protein H257_12266 [Aphanomyces astaci]ETV72936.1 hypothetical protein H257_12266 [Aphanomyces astaci]|eukprot:XP_009837722.1 hypothetical protein H257_12266 [Aphanomyces astaci]
MHEHTCRRLPRVFSRSCRVDSFPDRSDWTRSCAFAVFANGMDAVPVDKSHVKTGGSERCHHRKSESIVGTRQSMADILIDKNLIVDGAVMRAIHVRLATRCRCQMRSRYWGYHTSQRGLTCRCRLLRLLGLRVRTMRLGGDRPMPRHRPCP